MGGMPWRKRNTYLSIYTGRQKRGLFRHCRKTYGRSIEAIKFYLALVRKNVPVWLNDGSAMAARIMASDRIGIVPEGVIPFYCESYFPGEHILDFITCMKKKEDKVSLYTDWQPLCTQKLNHIKTIR